MGDEDFYADSGSSSHMTNTTGKLIYAKSYTGREKYLRTGDVMVYKSHTLKLHFLKHHMVMLD